MLRLTYKSTAFTLVELLVSIAIIGALVSLLLPSVQAARESSRRLACVNNQKQICLAVANYESVNKQLPTAGTYAPPSSALSFSYEDWRVDLQSGPNYSWLVQTLPFLEEGNLYDRIDFSKHIAEQNLAVLLAQPSVFICPSDETFGLYYTSDNDHQNKPTAQFGKGNYAGFSNPFHIDSFYQAGPLAHYGIGIQKITDGLSSTILLSEVRTRDVSDDQRGAWMLPWGGSSLLSLDLHPFYYRSSNSELIDPDNYDFRYNPSSVGLNQTPNSQHADVLYHCSDLAGAQFEGLPCNSLWRLYISAAPRSLHPGGVNVGFLDGRVQFLSDDVDEVRMLYMINISDGEVIPSE